MKLYRDIEHDTILTESDLISEFENIKDDGEHDGWTFADYIRECTGKNGTLEEYTEEDITTLKDFRTQNSRRHVDYRCEFVGCDFETATEADERTLEQWEESGAVVTDIYDAGNILYVECEVRMMD